MAAGLSQRATQPTTDAFINPMKNRFYSPLWCSLFSLGLSGTMLNAQTATWIAPNLGADSPQDWFAGPNWDTGTSPTGPAAIAILPAPRPGFSFASAILGAGAVELAEIRYTLPSITTPGGPLVAPALTIHGQLTLSGAGVTVAREGPVVRELWNTVNVEGGSLFLTGSAAVGGIAVLSLSGGTAVASDGARLDIRIADINRGSLVELRDSARLDISDTFSLAAGSRLVLRDRASVQGNRVVVSSSGARVEVRDQADVSQLRIDSLAGSPGTLDISGAAGTVEINNVGGPIAINLGANRLTFSGASRNVTLGGAITGAGGITWNNPGWLTMVRNPTSIETSDYSGSTDILQGVLGLFGASPSHTNIGAPAMMLGVGSVRGNLLNSGAIRPGDFQSLTSGAITSAPGTFQIAGDFTQHPAGVLRMDVGLSLGDDQLQVAGNATLGGQLQYSVGSNLSPVGNVSRVLLTASSVQGQFASIVALTPTGVARPASVNYSASSVELRFQQRPFAGFAADRIGAGVASHIDGTLSASTGEYRTLLGQLNLLPTGASVQAALEALAPDRYAVLPENALLAAAAQQSARDRLFASTRKNSGRGFDLFFEAGRRNTEFDAVNGLPVVGSVVSGGTASGVWRNGKFALGASLTEEKGDLDLDTLGSRADIESRMPAAFFQYAGERFFLNASGAISRDEYELRRRVVFSGFDQTATATVSGSRQDISMVAGARYSVGKWEFTPQAGLLISRWKLDRFTETGAAGANLSIGDWTVRSVRTRVGLEAAGSGGIFVPRLAVHWWHETDDDRALPAAFAGAAGSDYSAPGRPTDNNLIQASLGFDWRVGPDAVLHAAVSGAKGDHSRVAGDFSAGLRWSF